MRSMQPITLFFTRMERGSNMAGVMKTCSRTKWANEVSLKRGNFIFASNKTSPSAKCPFPWVLSFAFTFLRALLLLVFAVLFGEFVLLPLHLVPLLLLLGVVASLVPLLLLPAQHLFHVCVLEQG